MKKVFIVFYFISISLFSQELGRDIYAKKVDLSKIEKKTLKKYRIKEDKFQETFYIYSKKHGSLMYLYISLFEDLHIRLVSSCCNACYYKPVEYSISKIPSI